MTDQSRVEAQTEAKVEQVTEFNDMLKMCHEAAGEYLAACESEPNSLLTQNLYDRVIQYNRMLQDLIPPETPLSTEA